jgi:hypothetical protein
MLLQCGGLVEGTVTEVRKARRKWQCPAMDFDELVNKREPRVGRENWLRMGAAELSARETR